MVKAFCGKGEPLKVLLYSGLLRFVNKSGVGEAVLHQKKSLEQLKVSCTTDLREDFDIIHLNTVFPDSLIVGRWAKWKKKKVVYYAHSTMEDFRDSFRGSNRLAPIFKRWIKHCYNSGDLIITPTDYSKTLLEGYGLKRPIFSLSNGVDIEFFSPDQDARTRFRKQYGLQKEEKVILSVGHYIERKGILDFVALAEEMPQYQFYWFGYTNLKLVPTPVKQAVTKPLPNIHFPGYVDKNELRDAYCGSDLFLFLTHEETEGIVLLEALASKVPVLIRDIPIYSNWLRDGYHVYKGNSIAEFKEKIVEIIEGELPEITSNGYALALERNLNSVGQRLMHIYKHL